MKAEIVTYHNSYSYGACLQAWATLRLLNNLGYQTSFVDYHNPNEDDRMGKRAWGFLRRGNIKQFALTSVHNILGYRKYAIKGFKDFHDAMPKCCSYARSVNELEGLKGDLLVVGSDQMWNADISNGLDPVFFLQFGDYRQRIAIATSMGNYCFTQEEKKIVKEYLSKINAVSVREKHSRDEVFSASGISPFVCLDPTLLLDAEEWRAFARKPKGLSGDERYVLLFSVNNYPAKAKELWKTVSDALGVPVYRIAGNYVQVSYVDRTLRGVNPWEFVWLIDHADFVCTDSFHGTAFSLNLETPFLVFPNKSGNNVRMLELLNFCGLDGCFVDPSKQGDLSLDTSIDFSKPTKRVKERREQCLRWLESACPSR